MTDLTAAERLAVDEVERWAGHFNHHGGMSCCRERDWVPFLSRKLDTLIAASRRAFLDEAFTLFRGGCNDDNRCDCGEICTRCHRLMELEQGESCKAEGEATVRE